MTASYASIHASMLKKMERAVLSLLQKRTNCNRSCEWVDVALELRGSCFAEKRPFHDNSLRRNAKGKGTRTFFIIDMDRKKRPMFSLSLVV